MRRQSVTMAAIGSAAQVDFDTVVIPFIRGLNFDDVSAA